MDRDAVLAGLLEKLYAAVGTADRWYPFLEDLCSSLRGTGVSLILHDLRQQQGNVAVTAGTDPEALRAYLNHWVTEDPWAYSANARTLVEGAVVTGDALLDPVSLRRTAFFNEFARQYDVVQCLVGVIEAQPDRLAGLSVHGGTRRAPFDRQDAALLAVLMPHLQRAIQLHRRLATSMGQALDMASALDLMAHAVILLARDGRVTRTNRAADRLLRARDGLRVDRGELRAADPGTTRALRTAIASAANPLHVNHAEPGGTLALGRPSGRRPLSAVVSPFRVAAIPLGPEPSTVIVVVTDPERVPLPSSPQLRTLFGLTPAEARFALALVGGESLDEVADRLGITRNTARTHLRQLFDKTGTRRQAELIRLILVSTAPLLQESGTTAPAWEVG